jgi:secreted trypsin-like serine protease
VVTCGGSASCGCPAIQPSFAPRIINGQIAVTNSWPWMAYLTMNNQRTCAGFLISQRHVLTAASCVAQYGNNISVNLGINTYQSSFGGLNVTNATGLIALSFGDIAIVTLGINITAYTATIQPCCLTTSLSEPFVNMPGVIAGWGETSTNNLGVVSPLLQQAVIQVLNPSACGISSGNDTFCAGFGSISACPIDAGAPLMISYDNAWTCVGMVVGRSTCNNPITFTRIAPYASVIQNITGLPFTFP